MRLVVRGHCDGCAASRHSALLFVVGSMLSTGKGDSDRSMHQYFDCVLIADLECHCNSGLYVSFREASYVLTENR